MASISITASRRATELLFCSRFLLVGNVKAVRDVEGLEARGSEGSGDARVGYFQVAEPRASKVGAILDEVLHARVGESRAERQVDARESGATLGEHFYAGVGDVEDAAEVYRDEAGAGGSDGE